MMTDPVTALDGHTYERSAIEQWFITSDRSPMHNSKLESKVLIPNMSFRQLIKIWKRQNRASPLSKGSEL